MAQLEQTSRVDFRNQVKQFITDNFVLRDGPDSLQDDDSFVEKGVIDSTGVLELVGFIEETFSITVEDEELIPENLDSVQKVTAYIERKMRDAAA
jgi:acyl carrier protein